MRLVRVLMVIMFAVMLSTSAVLANDKSFYKSVTNNSTIIAALESLKGTKEEAVINKVLGNNISGQPIKVSFKSLFAMNPKFKNHHALTVTNQLGHIEIYINKQHQNAPAEAIACLLVHEVIHQDQYNSIEEETYAWTKEAAMWNVMKKANPSLNNASLQESRLVRRLNKIEQLYVDANFTSDLIAQKIMNLNAYKNLPVSSIAMF